MKKFDKCIIHMNKEQRAMYKIQKEMAFELYIWKYEKIKPEIYRRYKWVDYIYKNPKYIYPKTMWILEYLLNNIEN